MRKTRIGIICDMHLPGNEASPQYAFLKRAAAQMKKDNVDVVICLGDITSYGEVEAWELYQEALKDFVHYEVLGNSDVRDVVTRKIMAAQIQNVEFEVGGRQVIGINTPDAEIVEEDKARLEHVKAGDIIFMHHYMESMKAESGLWLKTLAENVPVIILHGHGHRKFDYFINASHVLGMRGLDPDKSIGDFPCINYLDVTEEEVSLQECLISLPKTYLEETSRFFGLSCVDNFKDVAYATEYGIKYVELRCNGADWQADMTLLPVIETWREKTDGYLSIHMPNLWYRNGEIAGKEKWLEALEYAGAVGAKSLTIHPPRVRVADMPAGGTVWREFLELYMLVAKSVPAETKIGIENLHKNPTEELDEYRGFGYRPEEVSAWIDAINAELGEDRVGHVLDVGHARNNGSFAQIYPSSKWYQLMGHKAIAYHIHQVVPGSDGLKNHNAIENWFGPTINYTSFFYAWNQGILNHVPVFLEVKGSENYAKSVAAFTKIMEEKRCET